MNTTAPTKRERVLDPIERSSEVLFGLIMVLSFTGTISVASHERAEVRELLVGALGCNLAWGIIDAVLYLMARLAERGRGLMTFRAVRATDEPAQAHRLIASALPPLIASVLRPEEFESVNQRLRQMPEPSGHARLSGDDWRGGLAVLLLVFLSTFPVVIPFLVMAHVSPALRVSNAIAIVMLFIAGLAYGRYAGRQPWLLGVSMVLLGLLLVALTLALGG
jgi:hypothetical protein